MDYTTPNTSIPFPPEDIARGKTIAILSYCTIIGWVIAIILQQSEKSRFGAFHVRQGLGLLIFGVGSILAITMLGWIMFFLWFLIPLIQLTVLIFIILGIINAASGQAKKLPVIGELSEKMLAGIQ
jgi:uncharacterized membrane protein